MSLSGLKDLTRRDVFESAGENYFARGEAYFLEGRVIELTEYQGKLTARVCGTQDYRVKLWAEGSALGFSCSCPLGEEEEFCKHCVAVALAWIDDGTIRTGETAKSAAIVNDLRAFLQQQTKAQLVEILLNEAMQNDALRERLVLESARLNSKGPNLATYRRAIKRAIRTDDFVDYHGARSYAQEIDRVIDSLALLLEDNHGADVLGLVEYAFSQLEEALGEIDDSDGYMGEVVGELYDLHLCACEQAKPEPVALARRLFNWETQSEWEFFAGMVANYKDVLGQTGLVEYRRLAEAEWSQIPSLRAGEDSSDSSAWRVRITGIMETLARQSGDLEELISVKQRDLSRPSSYLEIAETYHRAEKYDEALDWAERGWRTFLSVPSSEPEGSSLFLSVSSAVGEKSRLPVRPWRLGEFLADEYHRRGRHDEALDIIWPHFTVSPNLENYQNLHAHAGKSGATAWAQWRERALAHLRSIGQQQETDTPQSTAHPRWRKTDRSTLVSIFLWEKRYEDAWQEACAGGCTDGLWMQIAASREADHPPDALIIYRERIAPLVALTNNAAYAEAFELLRKVRKLMCQLGRETEFASYLQALKLEYKLKRNFIKLLDQMQ